MSMTSHVCPACQRTQGAGDGFCTECGTELLAARYCDTCGVLAAHAGDFCRECGDRLAPLPTPAPPAAEHSPSPPAWLSDPEPAPPPQSKPPRTPPPASRQPDEPAAALQRAAPAPLARRPGASPVPMRQAALPATRNGTGRVLGTAGGLAGVTGLVLMASNPVLGLFLLLAMFGLAGRQSRELAAGGMERVIDWIWDDPVLRRRLLGE